MKTLRYTKAQRTHDFYNRMAALGFSFDEANALRRIEMTLSRWSEQECGDSNNYRSWAIERDEQTEKPFMVIHPHDGGKTFRYAIADREAGALRRARAILARHPELWMYQQGDPRGCALYVGRFSDMPDGAVDISSLYTRGVAVCID